MDILLLCLLCVFVCVCVCVSNYVLSRDFKNEVSATVLVSETHTKRLLLHAQCFPYYQLVSSPPAKQLTIIWLLLHLLLFRDNRSNTYVF